MTYINRPRSFIEDIVSPHLDRIYREILVRLSYRSVLGQIMIFASKLLKERRRSFCLLIRLNLIFDSLRPRKQKLLTKFPLLRSGNYRREFFSWLAREFAGPF